MSPLAATAGTTGLVAFLATRRARAAAVQFERPKSGE
jgi:hypothetical protein